MLSELDHSKQHFTEKHHSLCSVLFPLFCASPLPSVLPPSPPPPPLLHYFLPCFHLRLAVGGRFWNSILLILDTTLLPPPHISANISAGRAQVASHYDHRHVFRKESVPFYLPNCTSVSLRWRSWDVRLLRRTRYKYTTTRTTHTTRNYPISRTPRSTIAGMD